MNETSVPWRQSKGLIALFTALIAAVPPATTGLYAWVKGQNEYRLAKQDQDHSARTYYLRKAIEPEYELTRVRYLRYLVVTESDPKFQAWATAELDRVEKKISSLERDVDEADKEREQAEERERAALVQLARAKDDEKLKAAAAAARTEARIAAIKAQKAETRLSPTTLGPPPGIRAVCAYSNTRAVLWQLGAAEPVAAMKVCFESDENRAGLGSRWTAYLEGTPITCECAGP